MCFSAEASFAASAVLGAGGIVALSRGPRPNERALAFVPVLFAAQQFVEGIVWVGVMTDNPILTSIVSYAYVFFAFFLWPIYVPLAVLLVEPDPQRRRLQEALCVVGGCVAVFITGSLARGPLATSLQAGHLHYGMNLPLFYESVGLYFVAVSAPCFSSHRFVRAFGVLLLIGLAATLAHYEADFISLWCYVAAALSLLVVLHLREQRVREAALA